MTTTKDLLHRREDLRQWKLAQSPLPIPTAHQVLLQVEKFTLSSNNVTYALLADEFGYWDLFPAVHGWGRIPVYGYARVIESRVAGICVGERLLGFLPPSTHVLIEPDGITDRQLTDVSADRKPHWAVYNVYSRIPSVGIDQHFQDAQLYLGSFMVGYLLAMTLRESRWHDASAVVITSASSKSALGFAHLCKKWAPQIARIGLTSQRNRSFTESAGLYDTVITYAQVCSLTRNRAMVVDFAGSDALLEQIRTALAAPSPYSCRVGATHWDADCTRASADSASSPSWFYSPDHLAIWVERLGQPGFESAYWPEFTDYVRSAARFVTPCELPGLENAAHIISRILDGEYSPAEGILVTL